MPDDVIGVQDLFPGKRQNQNFRLTYSATRMAKIVTTAVGINASRNRQIICDTADMLPAIIVPTIFGITDSCYLLAKELIGLIHRCTRVEVDEGVGLNTVDCGTSALWNLKQLTNIG